MQTTQPHRHRLTEFSIRKKEKAVKKLTAFFVVDRGLATAFVITHSA